MYTYPLSIGVVKSLKLNDIRMSDDTHNLQLTVLSARISNAKADGKPHLTYLTLKRLSWSTLLIAASSPFGASFV